MAIYAVTGKPRHGKTFFLVKNIARWLKQDERIYSNVKLIGLSKLKVKNSKGKIMTDEEMTGDLYSDEDIANPDKRVFYWRHIRDWNRMASGTIIADEGTRYFNPRKWSMLSEETEIKLQQHGKEDLDIWLTTQHYSRLDVTLRILIERFFIVQKIFGPTGNGARAWGVCRITEHYLEDMERFERAQYEDKDAFVVGREFMLIRKKYAMMYDTRQSVGKSDMVPLAHEQVWCEDDNCPQHGKLHGKPKIIHV